MKSDKMPTTELHWYKTKEPAGMKKLLIRKSFIQVTRPCYTIVSLSISKVKFSLDGWDRMR